MKIGEVIEIEEREPLWLPFKECGFHGAQWMHPRWGCIACWSEYRHAKPDLEPEPAEVPAGLGH